MAVTNKNIIAINLVPSFNFMLDVDNNRTVNPSGK